MRQALVIVGGMLALASVLVFAPVAYATANVAPDLPEASDAMRGALSGMGRTSSWAEPVTTAGENLWASANVPADLDSAAERSQVRWLLVEHCDETDSGVDVVVRLGPATDSPALVATAGSQNGKPLQSQGASMLLELRPIPLESPALTAAQQIVPVWARAASSTVDVCITAGW
jgi:hypothetical protein